MLTKLKMTAIAAAVTLSPMAAEALQVTQEFIGVVTVDNPGADSVLFEVGDAARVTLKYDSETPEVFPDGTLSNYAIDNITIRFGDYVATTSDGLIRVGANNMFGSGFADLLFIQTSNLSGPAIGGGFYDRFGFAFAYAVGTFSNQDLPIFLPPVSAISPTNTNRGVLFFGGPNLSEMRVDTITTTVAAVPAPAALPLLLTALGGLALFKRRARTA